MLHTRDGMKRSRYRWGGGRDRRRAGASNTYGMMKFRHLTMDNDGAEGRDFGEDDAEGLW